MRILITTGIFPPDIGGPATYVPQMARALSEKGHNLKVLTTSEPKHLSSNDAQYPFAVFRMNRRASLWCRSLLYIRQILRHGREVDAIYANGIFLETALANLWLRKPLLIKIVGDEAWERSTRRGWTHDDFENFQLRRQHIALEVLKKLRSWSIWQAEKVIVPSQYLAQWVNKWGNDPQKFVVVYNAVLVANEIRSPNAPIKTPLKVVTVGRLVPWKHIDGIIEAIYGLKDAGLIIIGDGSERSRLEELVEKLGMRERVYFAGERNKNDTLSIMSACDIFVLNSSYEGLPHVALEAMNLGLPVVATPVGGTPEIVKDGYNGILVADRGDGLTKAIRKLLEDKQFRISLASNARLTVKECFNFDSMIKQTESVLLSMKKEHH